MAQALSTSCSSSSSQYSARGRPPKEISLDDAKYLLSLGIKRAKVADIVAECVVVQSQWERKGICTGRCNGKGTFRAEVDSRIGHIAHRRYFGCRCDKVQDVSQSDCK